MKQATGYRLEARGDRLEAAGQIMDLRPVRPEPRAKRECRRAGRGGAGFTFFEICIVVLLACIVFGLLGTFVWRNARTSRATDRKLQAISAVHYLQGRLRRDIKGARDFQIEEAGHKLTVVDMQDRKRVYQYDPKDRTLTLPDLIDQGATMAYELARFREVRFTVDADGGGITYVISAVPYHERGGQLTQEEIGWGAAIAGRVGLRSRIQSTHYPGANLQGLIQ